MNKNFIIGLILFLTCICLWSKEKTGTDESAQLQQFVDERTVGIKEILKTPYYNLTLSVREIRLNFRMNAWIFYVEPIISYYPESAGLKPIIGPGVVPELIPYGAGAHAGIVIREIPDWLLVVLGGLLHRNKEGKSEPKIDIVELAESIYWYRDWYIYAGKYVSDKSLSDGQYIDSSADINVIGFKSMNMQKIRKNKETGEKYYITPGRSSSYNGGGFEFQTSNVNKDWKFVLWGEGKLYREWDFNWGLFIRGEFGVYDKGTVNENNQLLFGGGLFYFTESKSLRTSYRLGFSGYNKNYPERSEELNKQGVFFDVSFQF